MTDQLQPRHTVGILGPGEMGCRLGRLLQGRERSVLVALEGRSSRSRDRVQASGLHGVATVGELAARADIVLSTVSPSAAVAAAQDYRQRAPASGPRRLYVDLNSIAPQAALRIAGLFEGSNVDFVDGAVHGLAANLPERGTLYLSGPAAPCAADLLARVFRVTILGDRPGRASAFRLLISGLTKGINALFLEMALTARQAGLLDELLACYRETYPGVMSVVDRVLPTYPVHARRRADEMKEVAQMMTQLGLEPCLAPATGRLIGMLGELDLSGSPDPSGNWSPVSVVEAALARGLLRNGEVSVMSE